MNDSLLKLALFIRKKRTELGFSQSAISEAIGYGYEADICLFELGKKPLPYCRLKKLADVLGLNQEELFQMRLEYDIDKAKAKLEQIPFKKIKKEKIDPNQLVFSFEDQTPELPHGIQINF